MKKTLTDEWTMKLELREQISRDEQEVIAGKLKVEEEKVDQLTKKVANTHTSELRHRAYTVHTPCTAAADQAH